MIKGKDVIALSIFIVIPVFTIIIVSYSLRTMIRSKESQGTREMEKYIIQPAIKKEPSHQKQKQQQQPQVQQEDYRKLIEQTRQEYKTLMEQNKRLHQDSIQNQIK